MQIQKISDQNLKKNLPAMAVVIQLLDKNNNHLAFIACRHEQIFSLYDAANDREESHFLEEISNFEAQILHDCLKLDKDLKKNFGGWTGEMIITDENSKIIHHEKPFLI